MDKQETLEWAYETVKSIAAEPYFDEIYNIIHSNEGTSSENYAKVASALGLEVGNSGFVVLDDSNVVKMAAISIVFSSLAEDNDNYPIFLNHQREALNVLYLTESYFIITGFDFVNQVDTEDETNFLNTLQLVSGNYIITAESLLSLVEYYTEMGDISIMFSDYIQGIKSDENLLCDFSVKRADVAILRNDTLLSMFDQGRMDSYSLDRISKGII